MAAVKEGVRPAAAPAAIARTDPRFDRARQLVEETTTSLTKIAARLGVERAALAALATREGWKRKQPRKRADRTRLIERLWSAADRQVADIEDKLAAAEIAPADREHVARSLASVVKTIHDLTRIDEPRRPRGAGPLRKGADAAADADAANEPGAGAFRDTDELRRALAQQIDRLRED